MNFETNGDSDTNDFKNYYRVNKTKGKKRCSSLWAWIVIHYYQLIFMYLRFLFVL